MHNFRPKEKQTHISFNIISYSRLAGVFVRIENLSLEGNPLPHPTFLLLKKVGASWIEGRLEIFVFMLGKTTGSTLPVRP